MLAQKEVSLHACGARGAGEGVEDEEVQRVAAVLTSKIPDLRNKLFDKACLLDGLGLQALGLTCLNLL